jgi:hypothetical protein
MPESLSYSGGSDELKILEYLQLSGAPGGRVEPTPTGCISRLLYL